MWYSRSPITGLNCVLFNKLSVSCPWTQTTTSAPYLCFAPTVPEFWSSPIDHCTILGDNVVVKLQTVLYQIINLAPKVNLFNDEFQSCTIASNRLTKHLRAARPEVKNDQGKHQSANRKLFGYRESYEDDSEIKSWLKIRQNFESADLCWYESDTGVLLFSRWL